MSRWTDADVRATGLRVVNGDTPTYLTFGTASREPEAAKTKAGPNKTENEALAILRLDQTAEFEGKTFPVLGGTHSYTPDWWVEETRTAVEVKGEYIHSRDGRLLFDAARREYTGVTWIWARKRAKGRKGPRWEVETYLAASVARSSVLGHPGPCRYLETLVTGAIYCTMLGMHPNGRCDGCDWSSRSVPTVAKHDTHPLGTPDGGDGR